MSDSQPAPSPTYTVSVAAKLSGMHPQTLRQYDRLGLVSPARTQGRGRRYTRSDIRMLREINFLSQEEGINLAGIRRFLELQQHLDEMRDKYRIVCDRLHEYEQREGRVFSVNASGEVYALRRGQRTAPYRERRESYVDYPHDVIETHHMELVRWNPYTTHRVGRVIACRPMM